jgi:probable F420-dependent oxidoreductase
MLLGFGAPVSGAWATPDNLASFAKRAEELGYHSLWTFQRLLVDAENAADPVYRSVLDPLVSLGFTAAHTQRIRLGVAVVNLPFVSPAHLAKQSSTLDLLSGGRLDLGLGTGWSELEFTASNTPLERRGARAEDYLAALHALWNDEVSEHHGPFYTVPRSRMAPKPKQLPGPQVILGGVARAALERAGRLADGWVSRSAADLSKIADSIAIVREAAAKAGRDPEKLRIINRGRVSVTREPLPDEGRHRLSGSFDQIRADTAWLAEQGVTEVFYDLNWDPLVGSPDADPEAATERAAEILEALAP